MSFNMLNIQHTVCSEHFLGKFAWRNTFRGIKHKNRAVYIQPILYISLGKIYGGDPSKIHIKAFNPKTPKPLRIEILKIPI